MVQKNVPLMTVTAVAFMFSLLPVEGFAQSIDRACVIDALADADDSTTVGDLRALCLEQQTADVPAPDAKQVTGSERSAIEDRLAAEEMGKDRPFLFTAHQPNYLLASTYDPNLAPYLPIEPTAMLEDSEMMFQLSIKAPIWQNVFGSNIDGYFGYTTKSYWQLFNDDFSAPFRETNYQPELFLRSVTKRKFLGVDVAGWDLGINHESNGRAEPISRSWNRVMGRAGIQLTNDLALAARAWWRLPEDEEDDNNPRMHQYYGYGDVRAIWTPNRRNARIDRTTSDSRPSRGDSRASRTSWAGSSL